MTNKSIKINKDLKDKLDRSLAGSYNKYCGFQCVKCGEEVSPAIPQFYQLKYKDWHKRIKCYECQKNN